MYRLKCLVCLLPLLLACGRPASDILRRQPSPPLSLELALPDGPGQASARRAYLAAFREQFGKGLAMAAGDSKPGGIQLLVMIGTRSPRPLAEEERNRTLDQVSAVASGSPLRVLYSATGPKSAYEAAADHLGYRPAWVTGNAVVLKTGTNGFQKELRLDPLPILYRMHPLGTEARATGGPTAEEARAVAEQTRDLLRIKLGWVPPAP